MKGAIVVFVLALAVSIQGRSLLQLSMDASAPAPSPLASGCAMSYFEASGNYTLLLQAIQASSESSLIQALLSNGSESATIFAPTDDGIEKSLSQLDLSEEDLLSNPDLLTTVLEYHVTPSQLSPGDLKDGFSFNTLYSMNDVFQSVAAQGNGLDATIVGSASSAPILGEETVCQLAIYPIDGLLLSSSFLNEIAASSPPASG